MEKAIIVITGPTASGKTAISFDLAKKTKAEIICADSMTVFSGMDIGTDKPTLEIKNPEERVKNKDGAYIIHGVPHHMIDILKPEEEFNAAIFKELVRDKISEIHKRGAFPILVGGSLLYIDSYIYDFQFPDVEPDPDLRKELEKKSNEDLFKDLVKLDPDAEWTVDPNNRRRLIRALEVCLKTGRPFTKQKTKKELPGNVLYLAVDRDRTELYDRINKRVDQMMEEGFLAEVRGLYQAYDHGTAMQATGYRQLIDYLDGKLTLEAAISETKKSHRNFAKRQLTWLRGNSDVVWVRNAPEAEAKIDSFLATRKP